MSTQTMMQISPELRRYGELVRKVNGYFERLTIGKFLFGDASERESYYSVREEISKFEQELLNNRHTDKNTSFVRLNGYLIMLDNLRDQVRDNYEKSMGWFSR